MRWVIRTKRIFIALISISFLTQPVLSDAPTETSLPKYTVDDRKASLAKGHHFGIHMTGSAASSKKYGEKLKRMIEETVINTVVIDIKEETGFIYIPNVKPAVRIGASQPLRSDWPAYLADLKAQGVYTIARVVVNKDNIFPRKNPHAAVKNAQKEVWYDLTKTTWMDPYSDEAQKYNLLVALEAAKLGFDEIQFDYIRFPTDGSLAMMRFSKPFGRESASAALVEFLKKAKQLLHPMNVRLSIDIFGLTTSDNSGMGIGQRIVPMTEQIDYVSPMVYPSHYNPGEYGLAIPNDAPYKTIAFAMRDAKKALGPQAHKLRPWIQDFSLKGRGIRYGAKEVREQIQAAADQGVMSWLLWNARCSYTWDAIRTPVTPAEKPPETEKPLEIDKPLPSATTSQITH